MEQEPQATVPLTETQQKKIYKPDQQWSDDFALKVAVQDFESAEAYRTKNHDWRFREHFRLYEGWVQQKYWEGTRIPRSSLPVFLVFEQIESFLPQMLSSIFSDRPWFDVEAGEGEDPQSAEAFQNHVINQMAATNVREVVRQWLKSGLLHGNGIMELGWSEKQTEQTRMMPRWEPKTGFTLLDGQLVPQPVFERTVDERSFVMFENRPTLKNVLITDFYIDPNCPTPSPQDARFCATRHLVHIDEIEALRDNEEYKVPSHDKLLEMARNKPSTQGERTEQAAEYSRAGSYNPQVDQTVDPGGKRVEVVRYWTGNRLVDVINRQHILYNHPNPYGFMPFYDFPYADVPGRFYAMGMADVLEGEQEVQRSTINARFDELSINLHRPMIKRRGITVPTYALRSRPGQILEAENPKDDFVFPQLPNVTSQAFIEVDASSNRAMRITGGSNVAVVGGSTPGGNSANRTATGIGAQVDASSFRIQYLVQNAEDMGLEPMLSHVIRLNQLFPPFEQEGQGGIQADIVINTGAKFLLRGSTKMQSRMAMMQGFPSLMQMAMNPALIQELRAQGQTIDYKMIWDTFLDVSNYQKKGEFVRDLTEEEKQAMGQPSSEDQIRMQMQKERIAGEDQRLDKKLAAEAAMEEGSFEKDLAKALLPVVAKETLGSDKAN